MGCAGVVITTSGQASKGLSRTHTHSAAPLRVTEFYRPPTLAHQMISL